MKELLCRYVSLLFSRAMLIGLCGGKTVKLGSGDRCVNANGLLRKAFVQANNLSPTI